MQTYLAISEAEEFRCFINVDEDLLNSTSESADVALGIFLSSSAGSGTTNFQRASWTKCLDRTWKESDVSFWMLSFERTSENSYLYIILY